ncbi:helix-turn-helix transcriptional regulator [Arthrobacter sp. M4]|uniref:helix-turn-helix transcriptional regulator n=1 Tax=Arthrobacter sp. M4 TaxID=218160 RepID=UPI001CDC67F8|nr:helix-turn-helix transcriptional regulator [Arthrobacter sp. M4]MCA4132437.1 LuxR C-terminal-related transcriptional regulator [Arthrobacter sp. M4]
MTVPATALDLGRSAFAEHRWSDAFDCFAEADTEGGLPAQDLEQMASTALLLGRSTEGVDILCRAYDEYLVLGDVPSAARCAAWLVLYLSESGEQARSSGWMARARRLLDDVDGPTQAEGFLLIPPALGALYGGDPAAAHELFTQVLDIGQRVQDRDLVALGRLGLGTSRLSLGFPQEGLQLLDEVMVAVTAGEISAIPSGIIYCAVIGSCRLAMDVRRAQEWTAALDHWCGGRPDMVMFSGQCQSHRAELFILHGAWDEALAAARIARDRASRGDPDAAYGGWYQEAEVFRLRGDLEQAEQAYLQAGRTGYEPLPGLALLRLAQHKAPQAQTLLRRALSVADPANRCRLLPALVEAELAVGDIAAARAAADELSRPIHPGSLTLERALGAQSEAAVLLAEGNPSAALAEARKAWRLWYGLESPYDAARCRVMAGRACAAMHDKDSAAMEFEAAKADFADMGAALALSEVAGLSMDAAGERHGPLTARELEVLRLVAAGSPNKVIAKKLYLSEKTVARHVSNILTKIGVSSRVAATTYAYEHGLIT